MNLLHLTEREGPLVGESNDCRAFNIKRPKDVPRMHLPPQETQGTRAGVKGSGGEGIASEILCYVPHHRPSLNLENTNAPERKYEKSEETTIGGGWTSFELQK